MNNKRKTSEVWNYFTPEESDYIATCHICKKKFRYRTSTTNLKKHFVKKHPEYLSSGSHVVPMDQDAKIEEHEEQSGEITANLIDLESLKIPNINQFLPENFEVVAVIPNKQVAHVLKLSTNNYETLSIKVTKKHVYHVELNRMDKLNAFNGTMWIEIGECFDALNLDDNCRVIVLSAIGKVFTAGLDLNSLMEISPIMEEQEDVAGKAKILRAFIKSYQQSITAVEMCCKPVIAAIHSACIGAGVNLITAADMRYCTSDAWFQVKEVDLGMAADVGTLQRLPKVIGSDSLARELCYTARKFSADEALTHGLVSKIYSDKESMMRGVQQLAEQIAQKSPVAVQGTKTSLVFSRDHTVQEGLDHIAVWNQMSLQSTDFATLAQSTKLPDISFN